MKLVVGLGNPGKEYDNTRHNIGFMLIDNYLGEVNYNTKLNSLVYKTDINGSTIIFAKPLTYMNLSGVSIKKLVDFYKIDIEDILIIQDDIDMSFGTYKLKKNSSSGGHNGIKSIIQELKTDEFMRLKIGIGKNDKIPTDRYVLSKFSNDELKMIESNFEVYNNIIDLFIKNDSNKVMNLYNNN